MLLIKYPRTFAMEDTVCADRRREQMDYCRFAQSTDPEKSELYTTCIDTYRGKFAGHYCRRPTVA